MTYARVLYPSYIAFNALRDIEYGPYVPWVLMHNDHDHLADSVLEGHFNAWLKRQEIHPWDGEDVDGFLVYLEQFGYVSPGNWEAMWEIPFPPEVAE